MIKLELRKLLRYTYKKGEKRTNTNNKGKLNKLFLIKYSI